MKCVRDTSKTRRTFTINNTMPRIICLNYIDVRHIIQRNSDGLLKTDLNSYYIALNHVRLVNRAVHINSVHFI